MRTVTFYTWIQLLFFLLCSANLSAQKGIPVPAMEEAIRLKSAGNCSAAIPYFEQAYTAIKSSNNQNDLFNCAYEWADCLLATGKTDSALLIYALVTEFGRQAPDYEKVMYAYSVLGEVSRLRGLHRQAVEYNLLCAHYCQLLENPAWYSSRLSIIGSCYLGLSMFDSAFYFTQEAVRIKTEIRDTALLSTVHGYLAGLYEHVGELGKAAESHLKSLQAAELAKNNTQISNALAGIAAVLVQDGHLERAKPFAERALLMFDTLGLHFYQANVLNILASIEDGEGRPEKSVIYLQRALRIYQDKNVRPRLAGQYLRLARAQLKLGDPNTALTYATLGSDIAQKLENESLELDFKLVVGQIYEAKKDWTRAGAIMETALQEAIRLQQIHTRIKALKSLANISKQQGRFALATRYLEETAIWGDSLHARQQSTYVQQLEAQYKRAEQDAQISKLGVEKQLVDTQLDHSKARQKMLFLISLLAIIAASFGFFLFYQKRKNAAVLTEKNIAIESALRDKELLLREIHHRVKNNLQVVSSLLNLQSKYIKDPNAISAVNNSRTRVRSMALIHQNLYQSDNLTGVDVKAYFSKLLSELFETYQVDQEQVSLRTNIEALEIDVDTIIPIGLIINELVSNSLKHAFKPGQSGWLEVVLIKKAPGLLLEVSDNGKGFPSSAFEGSDTFGFKLIKAFAAKLEASVEITQEAGKNTVSMYIPGPLLKAIN